MRSVVAIGVPALLLVAAAAVLDPGEAEPEGMVLAQEVAAVTMSWGGDVGVEAAQGESGLVLVDEARVVVDGGGAAVSTVHRALRPLDACGVEHAAKVVYPFRARGEEVQLVSARRVAPDGEVFTVPADAVFVETPQPLAEQHLYADLAQLVVLFPGLRPGDTVEYTLTKRSAPIVPGEYSEFLAVADLWPILAARREIVLPPGWSERLRSRALGLGELQPTREELPGGGASVRWTLEQVPAVRMEWARQPIRQGGPGIWVSTVPTWTEVARWYGELVQPCGELGPELEREVAGLVAHLPGRSEIVRALHRRVTERVRYLGLEFGVNAVCPRPAAEAWSTGFGDCKEMANLLRSMLAHAGIRSHLVLVNTQHAGRLEVEVPCHQQFTHVVLAVENADGSLVYCDPSVPGLAVGMLPPSVAGRTALLVDGSTGRLIELPPTTAGQLQLTFELTLLPPHHVQGWLEVVADAYQSGLVVTRLLGPRGEGRSEEVRRFLGGFFSDPEVVDLEVVDGASEGAPPIVRLFFRAPLPTMPAGVALQVPTTAMLLPQIGPEERRQSPYHQHLGSTTVTVSYRLPPGWSRGELPPPLDVDTGCVRARAHWAAAGRELVGTMIHESTSSIVSPAAWVGCVRAAAELRSWLAAPMVASPSREGRAAAEEPAVELPRLATGRGQLELVDAMFPRDGDPAARRAALELVEEWFADDPAVAFEAGIEQVALDQGQRDAARSVERVRELLGRHRAAADAELVGWAEYLLAGGLRQMGELDAARDIYDRLARQAELSSARRGWAAARAADLRLEADPLTARAILLEALRRESPALEQQVALLARLAVSDTPGIDLDGCLDEVGERYPHRILDVHGRLLHEVRLQLDAGRFAAARGLVRVLERRTGAGSPVATLEAQVRRTGALVEWSAGCHEVALQMAAYLQAEAPAWWGEVAPAATERNQLIAELQLLDRGGQGREFVRGTAELLTRWSVAPDFFTFLLRRSAEHVRRTGDDAALLARLDQWSARLDTLQPNEEVSR